MGTLALMCLVVVSKIAKQATDRMTKPIPANV
jgi:hypothetical protein